jgi:hypothetical protein
MVVATASGKTLHLRKKLLYSMLRHLDPALRQWALHSWSEIVLGKERCGAAVKQARSEPPSTASNRMPGAEQSFSSSPAQRSARALWALGFFLRTSPGSGGRGTPGKNFTVMAVRSTPEKRAKIREEVAEFRHQAVPSQEEGPESAGGSGCGAPTERYSQQKPEPTPPDAAPGKG